MSDLQRKLLKELMQPLVPTKKKDFTDPSVCKYFLVKFCPFELFNNTKVDMGKCPLDHDPKLQKEYHKQEKRLYEREFYEFLNKIMSDVDRTIKKAYARLEHKSDAVYENLDLIKEQIWEYEERIQPELPILLQLGEEGKIAEAFDFFKQVQRLHNQLEEIKQSDPNHKNYRPDKRMEVCDVCGALLANDATGVRIDAHMVGKQHTGYLKIRHALEEHQRKAKKEKKRRELLEKSKNRQRRVFS
jgi:hypothetical protein